MKNEFVSYNQALALKELGFDEPCIAFYDKLKFSNNTKLCFVSQRVNNSIFNSIKNDGTLISAPLYQQAFSFFREKHKLHSTITSISQESWQWHITKPGESLGKLYDEDFYTYEEAESTCLDKLIEINKNK